MQPFYIGLFYGMHVYIETDDKHLSILDDICDLALSAVKRRHNSCIEEIIFLPKNALGNVGPFIFAMNYYLETYQLK